MGVILGAGKTTLFIVSDEETPASLRGYAGWKITLTAAEVASLPATLGDTIEIDGVELPGHTRTDQGTGHLEWVLSARIDPIVAMFNAMPGPLGWVSAPARDTWSNTGLALLRFGVPRAAMMTGYPALYDGAVTNFRAQTGV